MAVCNTITIDLVPFAYAFSIGVGFVIIRFLIAQIANDERGKYEAKYMFGEFVLGLVVAFSFAMIIEHLSSQQDSIPKLVLDFLLGSFEGDNSNYLKEGNSLLCSSLSYLAHVSAYAANVMKFDFWLAMNSGAASTYTAQYNAANYFPGQISYTYSFSPLGSAASAWEQDFSGKAFSIAQIALFANMSQYFVLSLFFSNLIISLLSLAVVFRTLPFTKGFANLLLAIIITFLVVLPILLYGESFVFHPPLPEEVRNVVGGDVRGKFDKFGLIVDNPFAEAGALIVSGVGVKDAVTNRYYIDRDGDIHIAGKKMANYYEAVILNAKTLVNAAFLATINLLAAAVSIKTLQIMLGDTDSLIEVMLRWV